MKKMDARPTVKGVHNDYTENSAPRRVRDFLGDAEAEKRFKKRWAIIQVWRPIRGDVLVDEPHPFQANGSGLPARDELVQERRRDRGRHATDAHTESSGAGGHHDGVHCPSEPG